MPLACLETDLDTIFSTSDFGVETPAILNGNGSDPLMGIFDDEHIEAQNGEGITVLIPETTFTCSSSKITTIAEGQSFTAEGNDYTVRMWKHDGAGVSTIWLEAVG